MKVAFDVDGTLLKVNGSLNHKAIDLLRWFIENEDEVYVWSGGGKSYAESIIHKIGIAGVKPLAKNEIQVDLAVDDMGQFVGTPTIHIKGKNV